MIQLELPFLSYRVAKETNLNEELLKLNRLEGQIAETYKISPPHVRHQIFNGIKLCTIPETPLVLQYLTLYSATRALLRDQYGTGLA